MTWVKICGITRLEDARAAFDAGADAIGINFWPGSKRYCEASRARAIVAGLAAGCLVYGVFVRRPRREIAELVSEVGLSGIQLHGDEDAGEAEGWDLPVIRAIGASSREMLKAALASSSPARLLVDNAAGGGSGVPVEADLLDGLDLGAAVLAGGLTPQNVAASVARFRPFGVDTAGGVETAPGIKDAGRIEAFVRAARSPQQT